MGTFEPELPDGMGDEIEAYIDGADYRTSMSELIRDAVRHLLRSEQSSSRDGGIHVNQQRIDRVDADPLEDAKSERE